MKTRTKYLASLAVVGAAAGALIATGPAIASPDGTATDATARNCGFDTLMHDAVVRENPDTNSSVLRHKNKGDLITFPCADPILVLDQESGVSFIHAECGCASDGIGWIRQDALH